MTGKRLNASVIINLNGNLTRRSREYSNQIGSLSRSGQGSLRALRTEVVRVSGAIDQMGAISTRTFRMLSAGALGIAGVGYTANKLFISAAAQREQQIIAMNSLYHGDKARADGMMAWAKQNAKETTWGLQGVLQEIRTATAFGMSDELVKQYISMLQNQGALHGWDLSAAQGASLQLKQMYARQKITAADASILTGYGINVYKVLADRLGVDEKVIRQRGEKGKLGLQSILMVFETLLKQSEGAQAAAMNSFDGMLAQIEANLLEFRVRVANSGPFEEIKNEMRRALDWHDAAGKSGELDALADTIGRKFLTTFRTIRQAAQEAWRWLKPGKDALAWVDQNIVSLKKLAAVLVSVWVANKLLRAGWAVAKPSWQVASYPFKTGRRIWHRMRNRRRGKGEVPAVDDLTFGSLMQGAGVQRVFVTNWPHGAGGYGSGGRRGNRGGRMPPRLPGGPLSLPGDPLSLPGPKPPALPAPRPVLALPPPKPPVPPPTGKAGLLARLANSAPGKVVAGMADSLAGAGRAAGGWLSALGGKIAGSAVGRVMSKGAETLGWMGKGAGRALTRLGGPLTGALMLAPVLMDEQASTREKAGATGSAAGAWLGGALGSLAGPLGTVAGATLGSVAGEYLGGFVTDLYQKWTAPDREPQKQTVNAEASLRVELGEGLRLTRSLVTEDGMGLNIYTGDNYITGW